MQRSKDCCLNQRISLLEEAKEFGVAKDHLSFLPLVLSLRSRLPPHSSLLTSFPSSYLIHSRHNPSGGSVGPASSRLPLAMI